MSENLYVYRRMFEPEQLYHIHLTRCPFGRDAGPNGNNVDMHGDGWFRCQSVDWHVDTEEFVTGTSHCLLPWTVLLCCGDPLVVQLKDEGLVCCRGDVVVLNASVEHRGISVSLGKPAVFVVKHLAERPTEMEAQQAIESQLNADGSVIGRDANDPAYQRIRITA